MSGFNPSGIDFGTYTPTATIVANLDSVTPQVAAWFRVGNTVTVFGVFNADPTAGSAATSFRLSLPVASNLSASNQAGGSAGTNAAMIAWILSTAATDDVTIAWVASAIIAAADWSYQFSYQVLP